MPQPNPQPTPQQNIQMQASRAASRIGYQPPPPSTLPALQFYQYARRQQQQNKPVTGQRVPVEELIRLLYSKRNQERLMSALDLESPEAKRLLEELRSRSRNQQRNRESENEEERRI